MSVRCTLPPRLVPKKSREYPHTRLASAFIVCTECKDRSVNTFFLTCLLCRCHRHFYFSLISDIFNSRMKTSVLLSSLRLLLHHTYSTAPLNTQGTRHVFTYTSTSQAMISNTYMSAVLKASRRLGASPAKDMYIKGYVLQSSGLDGYKQQGKKDNTKYNFLLE